MTPIENIIEDVIVREGGFVNNPLDSGGGTKFGVTQKTLSEYRKQPCTVEDVKNLSLTEARKILMDEYVHEPGFHMLASVDLAGVMVDTGVLHGQASAVKWLQGALGLVEDGILGAQTLHAANTSDGKSTGIKVLCERQRHEVARAVKDPSQIAFLIGWTNRTQTMVEGLA